MTQSEPLRVLIVEDSPEDRTLYKRFLSRDESRAYLCSEAETGEQALAMLEEEAPFDAVMIDYRLPDMDGIEFLETIAENPMLADLPVVFLTGQGNEQVAVQAMKSGAADYLVKSDLGDGRLPRAIRYAIQVKGESRARREKERLQNVLEMAGAVCHELNQPLMAISGNCDIALALGDPEDPVYEKLEKIRGQVDRIADITRRLMELTRYRTKKYIGGMDIIDIFEQDREP